MSTVDKRRVRFENNNNINLPRPPFPPPPPPRASSSQQHAGQSTARFSAQETDQVANNKKEEEEEEDEESETKKEEEEEEEEDSDDNDDEDDDDDSETPKRLDAGNQSSSSSCCIRLFTWLWRFFSWMLSIRQKNSPLGIAWDFVGFIAYYCRVVIEWVNPVEWVFYYLRRYIGSSHYFILYARCFYCGVVAYVTLQIINVNTWVTKLVTMPLIMFLLGEILQFIHSYRQRKAFPDYTINKDTSNTLLKVPNKPLATKPGSNVNVHPVGDDPDQVINSDGSESDDNVDEKYDSKTSQGHDDDESNELNHITRRKSNSAIRGGTRRSKSPGGTT